MVADVLELAALQDDRPFVETFGSSLWRHGSLDVPAPCRQVVAVANAVCAGKEA